MLPFLTQVSSAEVSVGQHGAPAAAEEVSVDRGARGGQAEHGGLRLYRHRDGGDAVTAGAPGVLRVEAVAAGTHVEALLEPTTHVVLLAAVDDEAEEGEILLYHILTQQIRMLDTTIFLKRESICSCQES